MRNRYENFAKDTINLIDAYDKTLKKEHNYIELIATLHKGFNYFNEYFPLNKKYNWKDYLDLKELHKIEINRDRKNISESVGF